MTDDDSIGRLTRKEWWQNFGAAVYVLIVLAIVIPTVLWLLGRFFGA